MEVASPSRWPATPRWTDKRERAHAALRRAKRQAANQLFRVRVSCTAVGGLCLLVSLPLMFLNGSVLDFRDYGLLGVVAIMGPLVAAMQQSNGVRIQQSRVAARNSGVNSAL